MRWYQRPAFGVMLLGIMMELLAYLIWLSFVLSHDGIGVNSDFGAQIDIAPITYLSVFVGAVIIFISGLVLIFRRPRKYAKRVCRLGPYLIGYSVLVIRCTRNPRSKIAAAPMASEGKTTNQSGCAK